MQRNAKMLNEMKNNLISSILDFGYQDCTF